MKRVYTIPDEEALKGWPDETFIVSDASSAEEMQKSVKPIKQTTLYYISTSSELVIRGHHYTFDGTDPESGRSHYTSMNQFNLRPSLPKPCNSSQYAASVYYAPHPHRIELRASYWDLVVSFNKYYKTTFRDNPDMLEATGHFKRGMQNFVSSPEFLSAPAPKDALVSSLGVVENFINREYGGHFKVKDFKFGGDIVLGMSMLFFYTFQNRLRLVYSFNDEFEKPEDIMMYLKSYISINKSLLQTPFNLSSGYEIIPPYLSHVSKLCWLTSVQD
ncbi:hypothetical protein F53441_4010 [Fusarium austroafricanum]|uniref:Uncharacterized protein n=1 Tax=Fusarium austroafricanum TaxID=2364996 RepID=A0A8H4KL41_9HYPO|nr:hypothetical protein F53441_4010 [Fusarium austroafricanum]